MQNTENKIEIKIKKCGRGKIFFATDFANFGTPEAIKKALQRLVKSGFINRVAHGIYYYPKKDITIGNLVISDEKPSIDNIAHAIAKRDKARIVPVGDYALNLLGLSTQVPMNVVYITNGTARRIKIEGSIKGILFKHTSETRSLAYKSKLLMLIVSAMREIGEGKIRENELKIIKEHFQTVDKKDFEHDIKLMPLWVRKTLLTL
jgi:predicted transcriptional regulator of viral defense system